MKTAARNVKSPGNNRDFMMIQNDVIEALARFPMNGQAVQVFFFILRKTLGYRKKWDPISLSQMTAGTGLDKSHVCHSVKRLIDLNILRRGRDRKTGITAYKLNVDYLCRPSPATSNPALLLPRPPARKNRNAGPQLVKHQLGNKRDPDNLRR